MANRHPVSYSRGHLFEGIYCALRLRSPRNAPLCRYTHATSIHMCRLTLKSRSVIMPIAAFCILQTSSPRIAAASSSSSGGGGGGGGGGGHDEHSSVDNSSKSNQAEATSVGSQVNLLTDLNKRIEELAIASATSCDSYRRRLNVVPQHTLEFWQGVTAITSASPLFLLLPKVSGHTMLLVSTAMSLASAFYQYNFAQHCKFMRRKAAYALLKCEAEVAMPTSPCASISLRDSHNRLSYELEMLQRTVGF